MPVKITDKNISTKRIFHIVPFEYVEEHAIMCNRLKERDWKDVNPKDIECDLYDHIKNEVYGKCTLGHALEKEFNLILFYKRSRNSNERINISINKANLYLFKNGIGFFVYELYCKDIDNSEVIKVFNYKYKELSYTTSLLLKDTNNVDGNGKHICECVSLGVWIAEELKDITVKFIPNRENPYKKINNDDDFELFCPSDCVYSKPKYDDSIPVVPDKAICFSYIVFDSKNTNMTEEEKEAYSFHTSRVYKNSYIYTEKSEMKPYREFENTYWGACQEGCSYIAFPTLSSEDTKDADKTKENYKFYNETMPDRIKYSYLYLYIRALYESRSLLKYQREISEKLSFNYKEYMKGNEYKGVAELYSKVNLFRTKAITSTVSFISLQVDFYLMVKKSLHIEEDTIKLVESLDALNSLQNESNSNKVNYVLTLISFVQAITSIVGIFDLVCIFIKVDEINNLPDLLTISPVGFSFFITISLLISILILLVIKKIKPYLIKK